MHWIGQHFPQTVICCQEAEGLRAVNFDKIYTRRGRLPRHRLIGSTKSPGLAFAVPAKLRRLIQGLKETDFDGVAVHSMVIGSRDDATLVTNVHMPYKGVEKGAELWEKHWQAIRAEWDTRLQWGER